MTTEAAAREYLRQHQAHYRGRPLAFYNPHAKDVSTLPVIYGFNAGGEGFFLSARLVAEDGTFLGGHACSDEGYMPADLGCLESSRDDRHEDFRAHYPDGYRMEFVGRADVPSHEGLRAALARAASQG